MVEPMDADFRERLDAYLAGGWESWRVVKRAQKARGLSARLLDMA